MAIRGFSKSRNKRRKEKAAFARRKRQKLQEYLDSRAFLDPIRGGNVPEDFLVTHSSFDLLLNFIGQFDGILRTNDEVYLDNGVVSIYGYHARVNGKLIDLGDLYVNATRYAELSDYSENIERLIELLTRYNEYFLGVIMAPNTVIIREVVEENRIYLRTIRNGVKQYLDSSSVRQKFLDDLEKTSNALYEKYSKHKGREKHSWIEGVMKLLPSVDRSGKEVSETDKKLVSMAVSFGMLDGRRKSIITTDSDLEDIARSLSESRTQLNVHKPFELRIYRVIRPNKKERPYRILNTSFDI